MTSAGLGLDYGTVRLERTPDQWPTLGSTLQERLAKLLGTRVADIDQIGSSSVPGLLAKPILDLAVGLGPHQDLPPVIQAMESDGWIYRGDAGTNGGHVFVLEARPGHRVAHVHIVEHEGTQWRNYRRLRDLLQSDPEARRRYEIVKVRLAERHPYDGKAYTGGKTEIVADLLAELD
jgi:GrpB-like predicted nucleotidyltransferase (UPF0157 family)